MSARTAIQDTTRPRPVCGSVLGPIVGADSERTTVVFEAESRIGEYNTSILDMRGFGRDMEGK
jgi:hypothetical protein